MHDKDGAVAASGCIPQRSSEDRKITDGRPRVEIQTECASRLPYPPKPVSEVLDPFSGKHGDPLAIVEANDARNAGPLQKSTLTLVL